MKEIFDIHRFGALTLKYYRENMKTILIFLGVMMVTTFVVVCKFNPFAPEYMGIDNGYTKTDYLRRFTEMFAMMFWGLLGLFSIIVASYSFVDFMSRKKSSTALLLPASSFEKFLLVTLNSTVVILLVHLALFYSITFATCSFKYGAFDKLNQTTYTVSWLGFLYPTLEPGQEMIRPEVGNVFYFVDRISENSTYVLDVKSDGETGVKKVKKNYVTPFLAWNFLIILWIFFVSLFMWGAITFRKRSALLTILIHGLFFLLLGWLTYHIGDACFGHTPREKTMLYGLYFYSTQSLVTPPSLCWLLFFYILPFTYLGIIWKKFKNKQV